MKFYLKQIPCRVAVVHDSFSVEVSKPYFSSAKDVVEHKFVCAMSKPVPVFSGQVTYNNEQSITTCQSYSMSYSSQETSHMFRRNISNSSSLGSRDFPNQEMSGKKACIIFHTYTHT